MSHQTMAFCSSDALRVWIEEVGTGNMPEVPNDRDCVIVRQANFGKE
jgi:hypothetical protein